ncbi:unnamed protein product [Macrosiphum euphorbiae]|uniref:Uncharacterized protein n=1 Tax=Macrosiphum euphorbiae TaxID=13131 RepID=A0AAV0WRT6_9HEMI|nr:unnamed protein product [Macrosiphum euphorbiae]
MRDNNTSKWSEGLRFIQLMKNRAYHKGINRSPYEALFGCKMKVGLDTPYILKDLDDEESLLKLVDHNSIGPNNQDDENNITKDEDNITSIDEDICTVDNNINTGNSKDDENIATNDEDIITTINEDICTVDNSINKGNYLVCSEENDKNMVQCITCDSKIHESGTISVEKDLLCKLCSRTKKTENQRREAHCNLELQAINMKTRSNKKFPPALVGNTVRVPISDVDRGRGEAHNVLACVLEVTEDGFYRLGNKTGVLKQLYARSQFTVCQQNFVALDEVNHEKELGLRSIATQEATGSGQGFIKCSCATRCQNNRCKCLKNKIHCNSKCHPNLQCCNK